MSDQVKMRRMLEILMLLSGNFGYTINEIAQKFNTSYRTIYRYLETFKDAGFKIVKENGFYRIDKKETIFKDLSDLIHFSEEEAFILSKAIHLIDDEAKFKSDLYQKLYYLFDKEKIAHHLISKEHSDNALKLKQAILNKNQVIFKGYLSSNSKSIEPRLVEPFAFTNIYDSVWALDTNDMLCKTFKIARITEVVNKGEKWVHENRHQLKEIDVFRFGGNEKIEVKFKMNMLAYNLITEEYPLSIKFIESLPDNVFLFNGWVSNFIGIGRFILGLMDEVEIIDPKELKDYLNAKIIKKRF